MQLVRTYNVTAQVHPLRDSRLLFSLGHGVSVEDAIITAAQRGGVKVWMLADCLVVIDGTEISKAQWTSTYPQPGCVIVIKAVPGKSLGSILTIIALVAIQFIPGFQGWTIAAQMALRAGITIAGALITHALSPGPRQLKSDREQGAVVNSINGVRNEARPYGTIPKIFGKIVAYYPPLAAQPYTENSFDNEQYLRVVFCLGYGPLSISDMKIGTTPLSEYKGVTYEIRYGYTTDTALSIFPAQVRQEDLSIELRYTNGYSIRRTALDTDQFSIDVSFPNGLQEIQNDGDKLAVSVSFTIQYRLVGASTWTGATFNGAVAGGGTVQQTWFESNLNFATTTGNGSGAYNVTANSKTAIRRTLTVTLPARGQYDVQIRRDTIDDQSDTEGTHQSVTLEQSYWTAIRSIRNEDPIRIDGVALVALRVQATDQLSGIIDSFNCQVEAILPVWDGSTWTNTVTRSPAWAYAEVLRGAANKRPLADARLDLTKLIEWASVSSADGITFDGVFSDRRSVLEALQDIAGTANASHTIRSGLYSVVVDNARTTPVQHFTPRNSSGFASTKVLSRRPHALKVRFPNEATLHQMDERIVYDDGYSAVNATLFETFDLPYTTDATSAYRRARRAMFAARLRPEIYELEVDSEHLVCSRGDLVRVTHDVPLWGVGAARVAALATSGSDTTGITTDAALAMAGGSAYAFRFRLSDGSTLVVPVDTVAGEGRTFTFTSPVVTATGPAVGDLALFGVSGDESVELIVRSIEPGGDLGARLTFVDYAPAILDSDTGTIPTFDPQITLPPVFNRASPPLPVYTSVASDEAAAMRGSDGAFASRILIAYQLNQVAGNLPAVAVQIRYREANTNEDYVWLSNLPAQIGVTYLYPVLDGHTYDIQIRSVSQFGSTSAWVDTSHTVVGLTAPPPDVERLYRSGDYMVWPYPDPPIDLAGFLIRANYGTSDEWGVGRILHQGIITASPFDISTLSGTQTIMIKAVDTSGHESVESAAITIEIGDVYVENVIDTQSEAPAFTGTISGGTDVGAQLEASLLSSAPRYGAADSAFYGTDGDPFYASSIYDELTYTATWTPASDQLDDGLLKLIVTVVGDYRAEYSIQTSPAFYGAGASAFYNGAVGDPFYGTSTLTGWVPWPDMLGPFHTVDLTYAVRLTVAGGTTKGIISQMDLVLDVPDIEEYYEDQVITVAANGIRLTPAAARRAIDVVNCTLQDDGGTSRTLRIIDKNPTTGALIKAYDVAGLVTTASFDARTKAH